MKPSASSPRDYAVSGGELSLSGAGLTALMGDVLSRGLTIRFCAKGQSMTPFILSGDVISVSPLDGVSPDVGAVVAFLRPRSGQLVVHRIVGQRRGGFLIRGDGPAAGLDEVVPRKNILGRVTAVEREGRKVRFGLGPERRMIAFLSRVGLLIPVWRRTVPWLGWFLRRRKS